MNKLVMYCGNTYQSKFSVNDNVITHSGNNKGIITNIKLTLSDMSYSYELNNNGYYWQEDSLVKGVK